MFGVEEFGVARMRGGFGGGRRGVESGFGAGAQICDVAGVPSGAEIVELGSVFKY